MRTAVSRGWVSRPDGLYTCDRGKVIGHISIDLDSEEGREDTRELGLVLEKTHQHKGIMKALLPLVLKELEREGVVYVWACCFVDNEPSRRLIESLGFEFMQEGEFHSASLSRTFALLEYCKTLKEA